MWVRELLIDEFDGGGDLTLHQLSATLNVIRLPSAATSSCLAQFVPNLLYGPSAGDLPPRAGSLIVAQQSETGAWEVLDLCRLPLESQLGLSDLQVLANRGEVIDRDRLYETLEAIDGPIYRAVFTDLQPLSERLAVWRTADWMVPLLRRVEAESEAEAGAAVRETELAASLPNPRFTVLSQAVEQCRRIESSRNSAELPRPGASQDTVPANETPAPPPVEPAEPSEREAYLLAKQQTELLRTRIRDLRERLQRQEHEMSVADQAASLHETWTRWQTLETRCRETAPTPVIPEDIQQLRRWNRQITTLRRQLQDAKLAQEHAAPATLDLAGPNATSHDRRDRLQSLLERWPACHDHQVQAEALRVELASRWTSVDEPPVLPTPVELQRAIRRLRRVAHARRTARHHLEAVIRATGPRSTVSPSSQAEIESLHRQIRQLREESRRLLDRQLLSRQALFGIGLLFSAGVAVLLSALLLNMDGAEMATGSIGLTCILAAALLKSSFERAPTYRMRQQRLRIAALLAEMEQLKASPANVLTADSPTRSPATDRAPTGGESAAAQARWEEAELAWLALLDDLELSEELSPASALRLLRTRAHGASSSEGNDEHETELRQECLREHESYVNQWCLEAAEVWADRPTAIEFEICGPSTENDESLTAWRDRLRSELIHLSAASTSPTPSDEEDVQPTAGLQMRLKRLKQRRRSLLHQYGARNVGELEQRLEAEKLREQQDQQREDLRRQIEAVLPAEPDAGQIRHWLQSAFDVDAEREQRRQAIGITQQEIALAQRELVQAQTVIDQRVQRPSATSGCPTDFGAQGNPRSNRLAMAVARAVFSEMLAAESPVDVEEAVPATVKQIATHRPPLLQLATQHLRQIWDDRWVEVGWDDAAMGPYIVDSDDVITSFDDLSYEQQHGLLLALQLSLVQCLVRRIGHLPMIVTDRTFTHTAASAEQVAQLLRDVSSAGQQVLIVTHTAAVSTCFQALNVPTLVVARQVPGTQTVELPAGRPTELHWQERASTSSESDLD